MRAEVPVLKKCCMCLPLRYGLIVWGYVRLAVGVLLLVCVTNGFFQLFEDPAPVVYSVMFGFLVLLVSADIVLNVVFLIGGHTKDLRLLRAYYIYSCVLWILMIIVGIAVTGYSVYLATLHGLDLLHIWILVFNLTTVLAQILIQAYVILLVRSELMKLTTNCKFKFVNKTNESECKMECHTPENQA